MDLISRLVNKYHIPQQGQYKAVSILINLHLIGIQRQRLCNLVNEHFYFNPLTIQHGLIFSWNLNSKHFIIHSFPSSFREPNHCLTLDDQPHYNFHILQCDCHLTMWKVERMGLWVPLLYKCNDQCMIKLYRRDHVQTL